MSTESMESDPYAAVLADLKAKRDQIDQAIQAIEALRGGAAQTAGGAAASASPPPADGPVAYLGLSIPDAARKLLATRRQPMSNADVYAGLKAGGLHMNSA